MKEHPLARILPDLQKLPPEEVIRIVRQILELEAETYDAHTPYSKEVQRVTTPVTSAEKLIRIGVMLMCIEVEIGQVISSQITNRIFIIHATQADPAQMCLSGHPAPGGE